MVSVESILSFLQTYYSQVQTAMFADEKVYALVIILGISIYSLLIWYFYKQLSKRDLFKYDFTKFYEGKWRAIRLLFGTISYAIRYLVMYPVFSFMMFAILSIALLFLTKTQPIESILFSSLMLIGVIRFLAYANEEVAADIAKLLPIAALSNVIVDPAFFNPSVLFRDLSTLPSSFMELYEFFIFMVYLEVGLRILYSIKTFLFPKRTQKALVEMDVSELEGKKLRVEEIDD
ncbi:hypothetical protein KAW38_04655 [Candidatus Micrarchaeota archaeon]|nr:hypothetical protein [Candidatus Micrarchaeota archaeon]